MAESRPPTPDMPEPPSETRLARRIRAREATRRAVKRLATINMMIRIAIAVGIIVASLFMNRSFLGWGLFAVLAVLIVPHGRARSFLSAFVPYAALWFVFTFLRSLADETTLAKTVNTKVAESERWLFNGELPSIRLQAKLYEAGVIHWYDYYCTFIHWSYFLIPHAAAGYLWWKYPAHFRRLLTSMTMLLTLGLGLYFLLPSNPPWMAPEAVNSPGAPTVLRIMEPIAKQLGGGLYQAGYKIVGESNPIAAMPSIHFSITFLLFCAAWNGPRLWRWLALLYSLSMGFALVYMGEHYVVDVAAGAAITAFSWYSSGSWLARLGPWLMSRRMNKDPEEAAEEEVAEEQGQLPAPA